MFAVVYLGRQIDILNDFMFVPCFKNVSCSLDGSFTGDAFFKNSSEIKMNQPPVLDYFWKEIQSRNRISFKLLSFFFYIFNKLIMNEFSNPCPAVIFGFLNNPFAVMFLIIEESCCSMFTWLFSFADGAFEPASLKILRFIFEGIRGTVNTAYMVVV